MVAFFCAQTSNPWYVLWMSGQKTTIGLIGQGWVGKNMADAIEELGHDVVRYSLEEPFVRNKDKIKQCDIVFIAVWTPTTPSGFDDSIVREVVQLVGVGKIAVIKSTMLPGTTESIQQQYPDRIVLFSPEFLRQASAADDARVRAECRNDIPHDPVDG